MSVTIVWFLMGTALVFFMQAGFAMVEAGFTRAKNTGNIIMKNLMDFCIGTITFILIGFGLLLGEDFIGLIGKPGFDVFTNYANFDFSNFVFNLMFCATTATIVSGAMAERTKFLSYCVYSAVISALIYPIEAHWIWGGGWLSTLGFHDFAGSCAIHMVGGISALVGAKILGPRIGKFERDDSGKVIKVNAFPGHNLTIGALGVFILWFAWYGFNGAAATSDNQLASIYLTTTVSAAIATFVCMVFTWLKYGKPDVSMCLNASLAGLVAITASCDVTDVVGALIIGSVAGVLVVFGVWLLDHVLYVDDPVGAVAVHCFNGIWGTIAVGLFATTKAPESTINGLFYGGGMKLLSTQLIGLLAVASYTVIMMILVFYIIKKTIGLRVTREEEVLGLDATEHGLASAYADFVSFVPEVMTSSHDNHVIESENHSELEISNTDRVKMTKIDIICKMDKYEALRRALAKIGVKGITVSNIMGGGKGAVRYYRGVAIESQLSPRMKIEVIVSKVPVELVIETARKTLYTGKVGDGKIFVYDVEDVVRVRTGERGYDALQDERDK
ncbi:MAG: ammonium transporter [Holdemanella sp.]|nr:ammonium transporter [Holdemanella sp.]